MVEPKIITHIVPQTVKVRKYNVNTEKLVETLRNSKLEIDITNKELAEKLNIPQTQVEHYFRKDSSFAIPDSEIWMDLKELLKIDTNEFDESIMTFEEREGVFEKANRIYDEDGLSPTLTQEQEKILIKNATKKGYDEAVDGDSVNLQYPDSNTRRGRVGHQVSQTLMANDSMGVVEEIKVIGNYMPSGHDASRVVDSNGLAPTVKENHGTVTAVLETINKNAKHQQDLIQDKNNICRCIPSGTHGSTPHLLKTIVNEQPLKIRKLTPKECWRLMGFDDEDFEKVESIPTSNTQLYKQAGNSIVVNVLEKIFKNLF